MIVLLSLAAFVLFILVGWAVLRWFGGPGASPEEIARYDAAAHEFLEQHRDVVEATRRPLLRIALEPMAADELFASKVGGAAWWPAGEAPPVDAKGNPLAMIAQVNLAELPEGGPPLPARGLLQWWVSTDWKHGQDYGRDLAPEALAKLRGHRVAYWPASDGPARTIPLHTKKDLPLDPAKPRRMRFTTGSETMRFFDWRYQALFPGGLTRALEAFAQGRELDAEGLEDALGEMSDNGEGHKLGGYPHFTQDDPRESRPDLELLLQLDTDDELMWGDAGVGGIFITDADLAACDFSRVMYNWDCY
jgi:uncharacterized protein YwqG